VACFLDRWFLRELKPFESPLGVVPPDETLVSGAEQ
jgi:hypothetical protein